MRLPFLRQGEVDLAAEFEKLCLLKALANDDPLTLQQLANDAVKNGEASPLVARAAQVDSWGDLRVPWMRMGALERRSFYAAVRKAAVGIGTTGDSQWAGPLLALQSLATSWFQSLQNSSMAAAVIASARAMPPNILFSYTVGVGTGNSVEEAQWTSVTSETFANVTTRPAKALGLLTVSSDLLRFGADLANNLLAAELRRAVTVAQDLVAAGILLSGLSPIDSSGDPRKDLRSALGAINLGQDSRPLVFVSPTMLKQMCLFGSTNASLESGAPAFPDLMLPNGGSIAGCNTMAVDALSNYSGFGSPAGDVMVVVDASQCCGDNGVLELLASNSASIQMDNSISTTSPEDLPTASAMVSMFQTNSVALRMTRWFNLNRIRQSAVAVASGCDYAA